MNDFKILKKNYGEEFAKFCRSNFPDILESSGTLSTLIMSMFEPSKFLYEDIKREYKERIFVDYIYFLTKTSEEEKEKLDINETPEEIFDKVGYKLIKCETDSDVKSFRKYYKNDEELCTFKDPERIDCNIIFFAVKKNVKEIKRQNFTNPERQDEYGTSVMSIQFKKGENNRLSIKNRYNHTVSNPDSTFSNNLDNIYPGLTNSFEKYYNLNINRAVKKDKIYIQGYKKANDGKMYKFNRFIEGKYYCPGNIIIDEHGNVERLNKDKIDLIDYFIIDKQTKEVKLYDEKIVDAFPDSLGKIKKIETQKLENDHKLIKILSQDGQITELKVDNKGWIIEYKNETIEKLGNGFLNGCYIEKFDAQNVSEVGDNVLRNAKLVKEIDMPKVEVVGDNFLQHAVSLISINLPKVKSVGNGVLTGCFKVDNIDFPELISVGDNFFDAGETLKNISMPKVKHLGDFCFTGSKELTELSLPNLEKVGESFLFNNKKIQKLDIPNKAIKNSKLEPHIKRVAKKTRIHMDGPLIQRIFPGLKNLNGKQKEQENEENLEM